MILYLDTSALLKMYVKEIHSSVVHNAVSDADTVATHKVTFVEAHSAFARLLREKILKAEAHDALKKTFLNDWGNYFRIGLDSFLIQSASEFAEAFALRAYDSVHLAAASCLFKQKKEKIMFASFDHKLNQAAKILGFDLLKIS